MVQPVVGVAKAPVAKFVVEWHVSQVTDPIGTWGGEASCTKAVPPLFVKVSPAPWQLAHPDVMPL